MRVMKKMLIVLILSMTFCLSLQASKARADCENPCGAIELIECAAQAAGMTAENFYNTILFSKKEYTDQFCKQKPSGAITTGQQKFFSENFCENAPTYYSYEKFAAACQQFPDFCCAEGTEKKERYKELANFLATIAQETTCTLAKYTTDGLYYRYENGALLGKTMQDKTNYYPEDTWEVATLATDPKMVYTQNFWFQDEKNPSKGLIFEPAKSPMVATYGDIVTPSGYNKIKMNQMIEPGYWVGMGATQLTKDPMVGFFGWYYNNLAPGAPVESADYKKFVETYLNDGELGFIGAIWYWMYRVSGQGMPTVHKVLNDLNKPVCRDIAGATIGVNGGCNDYDKRKAYYQYFHEKVFKIKIKPEKKIVDGVELNSMECTAQDPKDPKKPTLQSYCVQGSGPKPSDPTKRCGKDWEDADKNCWPCCNVDEDCPADHPECKGQLDPKQCTCGN
jgi:hypothetical protein